MDYTKFMNRKEELKLLKERISNEKAELIIVYGKRRVGKTELLNQLRMNYFIFRQESEQDQLRRISEKVANTQSDEFLLSNPFRSWDSFFKYIGDKNLKIVFDEFPYAVNANPSLPSIIQEYWDSRLRHTRTKIILCGSSITMMESLLGYKSPIYGRRTAQILVEPLSFDNASMFYADIPNKEKIKAYAVLGGTPAYILEFDYKQSIKRNIKEKILRRDAFLFNEVEFLLKEELKEPRTYFSLLSAIALGKTRLNEIMDYTGYEKSKIISYLSILAQLRLIERKVPITEKNPAKSRKGIYKIKDNYLKFWFKYIFQNVEYFSLNKTEELLCKIMADIDNHVSLIFEDVCKEFIARSLKQYILVGSWWDKKQEIDIIALNKDKKEILFGECKWSNKLVGAEVYYRLKEKTDSVEWHNKERKERYVIFAKNGFTDNMIKLAKKEKIYLFTAEDLV